MIKLYFLYIILRLFIGNPIIAILAVLVLYYVIDRRFIGLLPSVIKPFQRMIRLSNLRKQIQLNPHDMPAKLDLAEAYMERKRFADALALLQQLSDEMKATPEVMYDIGVCELHSGRLDNGRKWIFDALGQNPLLRYGEPYLVLARFEGKANAPKAIEYLEEFQKYNFSSCEAYYTMAQLQLLLGNRGEAKMALDECIATYRSLPKFRKKHERRWANLARLKRIGQ